MLYRLLFISFRLFFTGRWNPETLEPRVESTGTLEPRDIGTLCKKSLSLTQHTSADYQSSQIRDVVSIFIHTAARATLLSLHAGERLRNQRLLHAGSGCETNASHTQGSDCEVIASHSNSRCHLVMDRPRASRSSSHLTSGGRGVGFDMHAWGCLDHRARRGDFSTLEFLAFSCFPIFLHSFFHSGPLSWGYIRVVVTLCGLLYAPRRYGTQARPAIEFVSGKEGLRPFFTSSSGTSCTTKAVPSGDTPRWGLMAETAACCTPYIRCCPFSFLVQPQSTQLPATTEERWRRRHLSPGHKAGLLTVLSTCTGCAFQVTPGFEKGVTLRVPPQELDARLGHTCSPFFKPRLWYPRAFRRIHALAPVLSHPFFSRAFAASSLSLDLELRVHGVCPLLVHGMRPIFSHSTQRGTTSSSTV